MHLRWLHCSNINDPPEETSTWSVYCDNSFTDTQITIETAATCLEGKEPTTLLTSPTQCSLCAAGRINSTSSTELCSPCPANTFSSSTELCSPCALGTFSISGSAECDKPPSVFVGGMRSAHIFNNGIYEPKQNLASGSWYYESQSGGGFIYFDPDCDGDGSNGFVNRWVFYNIEPSTTAASDVDGNGNFGYDGSIASTSTTLPSGMNTWRFYCDGAYTDIKITIGEL